MMNTIKTKMGRSRDYVHGICYDVSIVSNLNSLDVIIYCLKEIIAKVPIAEN